MSSGALLQPRFSFDQLVSTNDEVRAEMKALRAEFQRLKAIETGTLAERDPVEHPWLH